MSFQPVFSITPAITNLLKKIEHLNKKILALQVPAQELARLKFLARLNSIHHSTKIEGNRLALEQVQQVLELKKRFPGREKDMKEVWGCDAAFDYLEACILKKSHITEQIIQTLHALVMSAGKTGLKPTPYRDGQNIIRSAGRLVYLPPEAQDVAGLMQDLVMWINNAQLPTPVIAGVAHYQFATIHPYFDGNGRTVRLLANLILQLRGYDWRGVYLLDAYHANDLHTYYDALTVGPSHNYYMGRAQADITHWVEYYCTGIAGAYKQSIST